MARLKFTGEVVREGDNFAIKVEIGSIPTQAQAQEIGKVLHDALNDFFKSKGAMLERAKPKLIMNAH